MRIAAGIAVIFVMGLGAGWWLSRAEASARPENTVASSLSESAEMVKVRAELRRIDDERGFFAERNAALATEAELLRIEQSELEAALQEAMAFVDASPVPAESAAPEAQPEPRRRGDRSRPAPTPEQMAEFRKNMEDQRTQMRDRLDEELAQMNDPNAVDNFNALMEYRQEEQQLQRQLRDATTDEARAKIEAQLRESRQSARQLLNDQQDAMLRNLAASSGITDTAAQQKLADALRATLETPFFRMGPTLVGGQGGPGGRGGSRGFGGGGFGNGRPPGAPAN